MENARIKGSTIGLIEPGAEAGRATGEVECRERLGGLLNYYYRAAA
ncbi:MAG TPA: hypothetical protein VG125_06955 [Pirellulales bacterium]|jgi:hypothetical protein|nr:hypothetical protein [Pirellulales bacterium]